MKIRLALLLFLSAGCRSVPARLDALFTDLHERGLFQGAVVVGTRDRVIFEKGYGCANIAENARFTPDTAADAASIAKTFTAALLLDLDREGVLSLDDPAQKLLLRGVKRAVFGAERLIVARLDRLADHEPVTHREPVHRRTFTRAERPEMRMIVAV